jgi:hypothetical protein
MFNLTNEKKNQIKKTATGIADWYINNQSPVYDRDGRCGSLPFLINDYGHITHGTNWSMSFAMMGLLAASKVFGDKVYERSALNVAGYLKTLQIFDPFNKKHYGAFR